MWPSEWFHPGEQTLSHSSVVFQVRDSAQSFLTVQVPLYVSYIYVTAPRGWASLEHHTEMEFSFFYDTVLWRTGQDLVSSAIYRLQFKLNTSGFFTVCCFMCRYPDWQRPLSQTADHQDLHQRRRTSGDWVQNARQIQRSVHSSCFPRNRLIDEHFIKSSHIYVFFSFYCLYIVFRQFVIEYQCRWQIWSFVVL